MMTRTAAPTKGKLRVWWEANVPWAERQYKTVASIGKAREFMEVLRAADWLGNPPEIWLTMGAETFEDGKWKELADGNNT